MVYSLLSMLGTHDKDDMSRTLLAMSSSQDSCIAMRQSGMSENTQSEYVITAHISRAQLLKALLD